MLLYCATTNPGKLREFQHAADQLRQGYIRIEPLPGLGGIPTPNETGKTFEQNAQLKAEWYSSYTDKPVFADDSGLEVPSLDHAPGVYSARYAGPGSSDEENNALLLKNLFGSEDRRARFVCVISMARRGDPLFQVRGEVEGSILSLPRGDKGFGYDPLFFYPPLGLTFAEIEKAEKFAISHRGKAFRAMLEQVLLHEAALS